MKLKILHVNFSSTKGGASRAALRINKALNKNKNINSKIICIHNNLKDSYIINVPKLIRLKNFIFRVISFVVKKLMQILAKTDVHLSFNFFNNNYLLNYINKYSADIVHLHWINGDTLSIRDVSKIDKNLVWTTHDLWPLLGTEHLEIKNNSKIFKMVSKKVKNLKNEYWRNKINFVAPSEYVKKKIILNFSASKCFIGKINHPINTHIWKPQKKKSQKKVILFGALGGGNEFNKGKDLFYKILLNLEKLNNNFEVNIFGEDKDNFFIDKKYKVKFLGHVDNDKKLVQIYNSAKVFIVTSRFESFCQTALEAQSCGVPVVSFKTSGLLDIIINNKTGYLINNFNCKEFSSKVNFLLENNTIQRKQSYLARKNIIKNFSEKNISEKYINLYHKILNNNEK